MKNWKKAWLKELDNITPELSDEVKSAPISMGEDTISFDGETAVKSRNIQNPLYWYSLRSFCVWQFWELCF